MGSNKQPLDSKPNALPTELRWEICGVRYKLLLFSAIYITVATMLHLTAEPRGRPVQSSMYHILFIKTENIAVVEIWRIVCSHLLARAQ